MGTGAPAVLVPRRVCQTIDVCNCVYCSLGGPGDGGEESACWLRAWQIKDPPLLGRWAAGAVEC